MTEPQKTILGYVALLAFFGVTGFVFGAVNNPDSTPLAAVDNTAAVINAFEFPEVSLVGKAAYVLDSAQDEPLYTENGNTQLPLASITKVPVLLLAGEHLRPDDTITFSANALSPEGDWGFELGEAWQADELMAYTLMTSSNDGAAALAEAIERRTGTDIITLMNNLAQDLGLSQTYFINETGLDSSTALSGAYGSARDVATLFIYAYNTNPDLFTASTRPEHTFTNLVGKEYEATNTNKVVGELPGLVLGKTGFTDLAGGNLGVVIESEPGHQIAIVVLGSTIDERFNDVLTLTRASLRTPHE